jgi:hypothetical protein
LILWRHCRGDKEPLIKSIMNRVADKNGILAATRYRETAVCGSGEGASSPHQCFAYREPMSTARRATPVAATTRYWRSQPIAGVAACCHSRTRRFAHRVMAAVILRCQGAQHGERPFLSQPSRALALRAVCCVRLLAEGITISVSPLLNPLPRAGEEAIVLSPASGGKLERGLAFLAYSPADTLPRSGRLREAGRRRHSRASGLRPPCHAAYPAKPNARPCGT